NATGGPVLGTGGTGDVLTGVVAGLLAQGLAPLVAAALGVYLHGFAGDRLAARLGASGVLAGEVARELPRAARALWRHGNGQGELISRQLWAGRARGHERGFSIPFPQS
ncbi:MAG TPA: NAD(P)H-hydrate dehydratase, partial [Myxococcota bacterium]|nr:NAD(P)H-hydrate dehydratase [Myxococcota bacterium]